ncbi:MAG: alpha/beta hydrolase [Verrucomicrobiota bacterium]
MKTTPRIFSSVLGLLFSILFLMNGHAQTPLAAPATLSASFPLWPKGAPGASGSGPNDTPTLTPFFPAPEKATGAAVIICPGGSYAMLAKHEGEGYAVWLNEQGIAAFVLQYRLGSHGYRHPAMMLDAQRAIRYVRAKAPDWHLDPKRVGIIGSSAGGHLASTCLTHFDAGQPGAADPIDRASCRPDLGILCYPVVTMGPNTHEGSRKNLLGDHPSAALIDGLSNEKQVTRDTPPTFLFHTVADNGVKVENTLDFASALRRNGVPFSLHVYPNGGHGMGLGDRDGNIEHRHPWTRECALWLKELHFGK